MDGGVGVQGADDDLELRVDALLLSGVFADEREGTNTLAVETLVIQLVIEMHKAPGANATHHVLGERLAEGNVVALLHEVTDGKSILIGVTTGEALVGHVEEGEVALLLNDIGDLPPLLRGGVNASGVVGAGVPEEDAAVGGGLDVGDEALEVEANGLLVVVAVLLNLEAGMAEDGLVVSPRRVGDVDLLLAGEELGEEGSADAEGTSAGDGLGDGDAVEGDAVTIGELSGSGGELRDTGDAGVLLVQLAVDNLLLGLADGGEDVGLASIVTVGTDTCGSGESDHEWSKGAGVDSCHDVVGGQRRAWHEVAEGADIPRLIFFSNLSALKASVIPVDEGLVSMSVK